MKWLVWLLFGASALGVETTPKLVRLAVSPQLACALAEWGGTTGKARPKCWDLTGRALPIPDTGDFTELAISDNVVCAIAADRASCWEYSEGVARKRDDFKKVKEPSSLTAARGGGFCLIEGRRLMLCNRLASFGGPFIRPYKLSLGNHLQICALDSDGRHTISCIGANYDTHAACNEHLKKIYFSSVRPDEIRLSSSRHGDCHACVIERRSVYCWGALEPLPPLSSPSFRRYPESEGVRDPKLLTFLSHESRRLPCVLDARSVKCRYRGYRFDAMPGYEGFEASAIDGLDDTHCSMNSEEMLCHSAGAKFRWWHGLSLHFGLETLDKVLVSVAAHTYRDKAEVLKGIAAIVAERKEELDRGFVLIAIGAFLENLESDLFSKVIAPNYREARERLGKKALVEFPTSATTTLISLDLIRVALPMVRKAMTEPAAAGRLDELLSKLGFAIARRAEPAAVSAFLAQYEVSRSDLQGVAGGSRLRGNVLMIEALVEYLKR